MPLTVNQARQTALQYNTDVCVSSYSLEDRTVALGFIWKCLRILDAILLLIPSKCTHWYDTKILITTHRIEQLGSNEVPTR